MLSLPESQARDEQLLIAGIRRRRVADVGQRDVLPIWCEFLQLVEDDGSFETVALQQAEVQPVVQAALPSSAAAGVAIVVEVLGVSESDVCADEFEGFAQVITAFVPDRLRSKMFAASIKTFRAGLPRSSMSWRAGGRS